jgi:tRNA A22 N-methylase
MIEVIKVYKHNDDYDYQISIDGMLVGAKLISEHEAHIVQYWLCSALYEIVDLRDRELI